MATREAMRSLAEDIVGSCAERIATIGELRETVKLDRRELRTHLAEIQDSRRAMAGEVRASLARDAANRKHEVGVMLDGFKQALSTIGKETRADLSKGVTDRQRAVGIMKRAAAILLRDVGAELKALRSELAGVRKEWQKMTATIQAKRGGVALAVEPLTEESTTLRRRVFDYIANHPDGSKMTELEQEFGLSRIQMAKLLKNLVAENKVDKRELFYFAV